VLVNDHAPNVETVGDAGPDVQRPRGRPALTRQLERLFDDPALVEHYRDRARERARRYSWDAVTDQYEGLLRRVHAASGPGPLPRDLVDAPDGPAPAPAGDPGAGDPVLRRTA
jgi:hypothetical protein